MPRFAAPGCGWEDNTCKNVYTQYICLDYARISCVFLVDIATTLELRYVVFLFDPPPHLPQRLSLRCRSVIYVFNSARLPYPVWCDAPYFFNIFSVCMYECCVCFRMHSVRHSRTFPGPMLNYVRVSSG